jgi:uncharacterized RDD family membrane protein YckC
VTTPENPARWADDPLGRHQYRYWDGAAWTEHVADDGRVGVDPPVTRPAPNGGTPPPMPGTGASSWGRPVPRHDPTAVLGRRYGAFAIDAAVCLVVFSALFLATATARTRTETLRIPGCHVSSSDSSQVECDNRVVVTIDDTVYEAAGGWVLLGSVVFTFLYFALPEGIWRGSPGKLMVGLRVVDDDGKRIGIPRAAGRWALFAIDGPLSLFLCGIITSAVSKGHRRLGDMGANSYVVARADADQPIVIPSR